MEPSLDQLNMDQTDVHPLVVDLDGTLLRSDLLFETGMSYARNHPAWFYKPLQWLRNGKAALKTGLSCAPIDFKTLPYDEEVIKLIQHQRNQGRKVILATASHYSLAQGIADHLSLFDDVLATDEQRNLAAHNKRDLLVEKYGEGGFDYIGNSQHDLIVWQSARHAYVVNPEAGVESSANKLGNVKQVIHSNSANLKDWLKAARLHQWMKNLLIFVPLLASHQLTNGYLFWHGLIAFLCFGLCASSVYILNDLLDLADDRAHKRKRHRPFASGRLSIKSGLMVFPALLAIAFSTALLILPWQFIAVLAGYYALTLAYSLSLKRKMGVDVIVLAMLYTTRVIAGAGALDLPLTFWILAFSMFIFLSLAFVKRYAELVDAQQKGRTEKTRGRGYFPDDAGMIASLGAASGYLSVMVMALYIQDTATIAHYSDPRVIWLACPLLLFWITRVWMLTHRGEMHDDPVVFAVTDRISLLTGALFGLVFWVAV